MESIFWSESGSTSHGIGTGTQDIILCWNQNLPSVTGIGSESVGIVASLVHMAIQNHILMNSKLLVSVDCIE